METISGIIIEHFMPFRQVQIKLLLILQETSLIRPVQRLPLSQLNCWG